MPWRAHWQLFHLCLKYTTVTIINSIHSFLCLLTMFLGTLIALHAYSHGELAETYDKFLELRAQQPLYDGVVVLLQWYCPVLTALMVCTNFIVVKDSVEGKYCPLYLHKIEQPLEDDEKQFVALDKRTCDELVPAPGPGIKDERNQYLSSRKLTPWNQLMLISKIAADIYLCGQLTLIVYGTIPLYMTVVALSRNGHKFDYIVAAKPETGVKPVKGKPALENV